MTPLISTRLAAAVAEASESIDRGVAIGA